MSGLLTDSLASSAGSLAVDSRELAGQSASRPRGQWQGRPIVVAEDVFREVLVRERKRADRFGQPFALALVALRSDRVADAATWAAVAEALATAKRETDILGWFEKGAVLAMIMPEIDVAHDLFRRELESRVQVALSRRLDLEARSDFSVRIHVHVLASPASAQPSDSLLLKMPVTSNAVLG